MPSVSGGCERHSLPGAVRSTGYAFCPGRKAALLQGGQARRLTPFLHKIHPLRGFSGFVLIIDPGKITEICVA